MTPPSSIQNLGLGRSALWTQTVDQATALEESRHGAQAFQVSQEADDIAFQEAEARFLSQADWRMHEELLTQTPAIPRDQIAFTLAGYLRDARAGDRRKYYEALRLIHFQFHSATPAAAPQWLRQYLAVSQEYLNLLEGISGMSAEERFRYLYAATKISRSILALVEHYRQEEPSIPHADIYRGMLQQLLHQQNQRMLDFFTELRTSGQRTDHLEGVAGQIELHEALLNGDLPTARQIAQQLREYYLIHRPTPGDLNWFARADLLFLEESQGTSTMGNLARLDIPSPMEAAAGRVNLIGMEFLYRIAATLDGINEEDSSQTQTRYRSLGAVLTVLILQNPGQTLGQLLSALRNDAASSGFLSQLQEGNRTNSELSQLLEGAGGNLEVLLAQAREAANHLQRLSEGPGRNLLGPLLREIERHHPFFRLNRALRSHPGLVAELGLSGSNGALELFRRGNLVLEQLEHYGERHPEANIQILSEILNSSDDPSIQVSSFAEELLTRFENVMAGGEDHEVSALASVLQFLTESESQEGLSLWSSEVLNRARDALGEMEGFLFRAGRIGRHLFSHSSLASLGLGILTAELMPLALLSRAGTAGAWAPRLLGRVVQGGRLTPLGSLWTGMATGIGMSLIGTSLHSWERHRQGFETFFWRDLVFSMGTNLFTFGLTLPFSNVMNRILAMPPASGGARRLTTEGFFVLRGLNNVVGGTLSYGSNLALRLATTGEFTSSWDEAAEIYASLFLWEWGGAGLRGGFPLARRGFQSVREHLPSLSLTRMPVIKISHRGRVYRSRFRSLQDSLDIGRENFPQLFDSDRISRLHFDLKITQHEGQPRYQLMVQGQNGLKIEGTHLRVGEHRYFAPGRYELFFPVDADHPDTNVGPYQLELPPIPRETSPWWTRLRKR